MCRERTRPTHHCFITCDHSEHNYTPLSRTQMISDNHPFVRLSKMPMNNAYKFYRYILGDSLNCKQLRYESCAERADQRQRPGIAHTATTAFGDFVFKKQTFHCQQLAWLAVGCCCCYCCYCCVRFFLFLRFALLPMEY